MPRIDKTIIEDFNKTRQNPKFLCNVPFTSMNISINGLVSPCCYKTTLCDDYSQRSINEIFNGKIYKQYRKAIRKGQFPEACSICRNSLLNGEYDSVMIHYFDYLKTSRILPNKIRHITVALSNVCNLECIMCSGLSSSSIRKNREKHEPVNTSYMNRFRNEIKPLLPNMQSFTFSGGEPFLNPVYYDIWEDIIKINPKITMNIITNGTVLNDKIKRLLDKGDFNINVSFNGITKETYETIHVNANFEKTKANIMYFGDYMKKNSKPLIINICPLKLNKFEIPDIVRFCNKNKYHISILKVFRAIDAALFSSTIEDLVEIKKFYKKQKFDETNDICHKNISEFNDLIRRIDHWIELAKDKNNFMNLFDLNTDKIDSLEKQLFNNLESTLNTMNNNANEVQLKLKYIKEKWQIVFTKLPPFFKSNHFYQRLLCISPIAFIESIMYGDSDWICSICNEIFYYGLNHR